jgi:hypothetical protein
VTTNLQQISLSPSNRQSFQVLSNSSRLAHEGNAITSQRISLQPPEQSQLEAVDVCLAVQLRQESHLVQ